MAMVVRVCETNEFKKCRREQIFRDVVGTYSFFQDRSIWRLSNLSEHARLNARIPEKNIDRMHVYLSAYTGNARSNEEVHLAYASFETRKSGKS